LDRTANVELVMKGAALVLTLLVSLAGCGTDAEQSADQPDPTPVVRSGTSAVEASLEVCGPACDGPVIVGEAPNTLVADRDIVVRVPSPHSVSAAWASVLGLDAEGQRADFTRRDDQTVVAPAPPPGCHRASFTVSGVDEFDWTFVVVIRDDINRDCG
jgi:hypothetical protein